jgi:hypothetical protein
VLRLAADAIVRRATHGAFAAMGPDASPVGAILRVAADGAHRVFVAVDDACGLARHLARDARASLLVVGDPDDDAPAHVTLVGEAELVDGDEACRARASAGVADGTPIVRLRAESACVVAPAASGWIRIGDLAAATA